MDVVWSCGNSTVRDIHRLLSKRREIAYTTVMTIMGNLTKKGVLRCARQDRAYVYSPAVTRDQFTRARIAQIVDGILHRFSEPAMTYLVNRMAQVDPQRLTELEEAIAELRRKAKESPGG